MDIANFWSHNRWMNRLSEDFRTGDGPRVVAPGVFDANIPSVLQEIETDDIDASVESIEYDDYNDVTEATTLPHPTSSSSSTRYYPVITPSPVELAPLITTDRPSTTTPFYHQLSSMTVPPVTHRPQTSTEPTTTITRRPITSTTTTEIPWLILQSPDSNQGPISRPKSTTKRPTVFHTRTARPTVTHPTVVVTPKHPVTFFQSTTVGPTTTSRSPPTKIRPITSNNNPDIPWLILKSSSSNKTNNYPSTG